MLFETIRLKCPVISELIRGVMLDVLQAVVIIKFF